MQKTELAKFKLPDSSGIYRFHDELKRVLYVGKATSLRDRVRSYFANDLLHTRGKHIVDMVTLARSVTFEKTDSVLEALILEASEIKKLMPQYNTAAKDDKSWNYIAITKEDFPKIFTIRERSLVIGEREKSGEFKALYGPFTQGGSLQEALKIIRRIFPYRDEKCHPNSGKPCFNRQIGLCPGVCTGEISMADYAERVKEISLLFDGKKRALVQKLKKTMQAYAKEHEFEKAGEYRDMILALKHIRDVSLIKEEVREVSQRTSRGRGKAFRIEAYDIAHISGKYTVGVMVVVEDGRPKKSDYRKFRIREASERSDDTLHLAEILRRRLGHSEWPSPDLVVIDGGIAQKRRAERVFAESQKEIDVVSVVKDARHKPKNILGSRELAESYRRGILIANAEAHRFAVEYHRKLRGKSFRA